MNYTLRYKQPAEDSVYGWENQSMPIGNGYYGANIFGIVERERIQVSDNALHNAPHYGGMNNMAEIYIHTSHKEVEDYERGLNLNKAIAYTRYTADGVHYEREYFMSYPDNVLGICMKANAPFSCRIEMVIPYLKPYAKEPGDRGGKSGAVQYEGNRIHMSGTMEYYNLHYCSEAAIVTDGTVRCGTDGITIDKATEIFLYSAFGTNYELRPEVFLQEDPLKKLRDFDPVEPVLDRVESALKKGYEALYEAHMQDYQEIFNRVELDLGEEDPDATDAMLRRYANGENIPYLEMLYFQYGRYLLIASSRKGTLPSSAQGVWNVHDDTPWGCGYWHNINVQMNYWPAFVANMAETFTAYADFNEAFRPKAQLLAEDYIQEHNPDNYVKGACGWTIGTGSYAYIISEPGGHSGPGTGGLTSKMFWDYYDFTRDPEVLKDVAYPVLRGMSEFLTKTVEDFGDGEYRTSFSASPEQMLNRLWIDPRGRYHQTVGCAFDQQMIYENGRDYMKAASLLGYTEDPLYKVQKEQIDYYHPVRIGWSGQIKEYEEENLYGEIGEYHHRHLSQLIGLYPGTVVNHTTPAWMDAAKYTLTERGDQATGWALAHRLNAWARTGDGDHAYTIFRNLLATRTMDNLWDTHPPFQIDGNFGGVSGVAEMLLQSHEGYISILPSLPKAWSCGHYKGLVARGAFEVEVSWKNGHADTIIITSKAGGECKIHYPRIEKGILENGNVTSIEKDQITLDTTAGERYQITDIPVVMTTAVPTGYVVDRDSLNMSWDLMDGTTYRIYRNTEDAPDYELAATVKGNTWRDELEWENKSYVMYKLTAQKDGEEESEGAVVTINHATKLYMKRYKNWLADTRLHH